MADDTNTAKAANNSIRVQIVKTPEQLQHAYTIRAICFMEENGVAAGLSFDGNDLQATHVVIYVGAEPIGALRIRWFGEFAELERTAMRKAYRNPRYLKIAAEEIFKHIARKGYKVVITHAAPLYARLWERMLGFKRVEGKPPAVFAGHPEPYVELIKHLDVPQNAITMASDAQIIFRTEGEWDVASQFEAG
jgi:hypothetical protein